MTPFVKTHAGDVIPAPPPSEPLYISYLLRDAYTECWLLSLWLSATWIIDLSISHVVAKPLAISRVHRVRLIYTQYVQCEGLNYCYLKCADVSPLADSS